MNLSDNGKAGLGFLLTFLFCTALCAYYFANFLFSPNSFLHPFGGDGFFIIYNVFYHMLNGDGWHLSSMNYPYGEMITMTDSQATISYTFSLLKSWGFNIDKYAIGIINIFSFYSIPFSAGMIFLILKKIKQPFFYSIIASAAIAILSPHIIRITCGHFGLVYAFLIPVVIHWILSAKLNWKWYLHSLVISFVVVGIGLNNFYLFLIGSMLCLTGALAILINRESKILATIVGFIGSVPIATTYLLTKIYDPVSDRVEIPGGFLKKKLELITLPFEKHGLLHNWLQGIYTPHNFGHEGYMYAGLVPCLIFIIGLGYLLRRYLKKDTSVLLTKSANSRFNVLAVLSLLFLALAAKIPFIWLSAFEELLYKIPILPQFRGIGRFAWVFYYCFGIMMAVWFGNWYSRHRNSSNHKLAYTAVILLLGLWIYDGMFYLNQRDRSGLENPFSQEKMDGFRTIAAENSITSANYQALFMLPTMNAWTDKVFHEGSWKSYFYGMRFCAANGIPMLNAMLSRGSVSQNFATLQVVSDPLIERDRFSEFPDQRPILLFAGNGVVEHKNEKALIEQADTLFHNDDYTIYSYNPWQRPFPQIAEAQNHFSNIDSLGSDIAVFEENFENENSSQYFFGKSGKDFGKGANEITKFALPDTLINEALELSVWWFINTDKSGAPSINVRCHDENGKEILKESFNLIKGRETQNGWARATILFEAPEKTKTVQIKAWHHSPYTLDQVLVRKVGSTVIQSNEQDRHYFSYNNCLVKKVN